MCFVWISEQTAIISLYSINWLVFITETDSVYCAVRTESLYIIQGNARSVVNKVALGKAPPPPSISVFPWPEFRVEICCQIIKLFVKCVLVVTEKLDRYYDYYEVSYKDSPRQYKSSNTPYSSSATCCSYHKDKSAKPRNLQKSNSIREIWAQWTKQYLAFKGLIVCTFCNSILIFVSRF